MKGPTISIYLPSGTSEKDVRDGFRNLAVKLGFGKSPGKLLKALAADELDVSHPPAPPLPGPTPSLTDALSEELGVTVTPDALARAAGRVADMQEVAIRMRREISVHGDYVALVVLEGDENHVTLFPADVSVARALLCTIDEHAPPQVGEALTMPIRLADGRVISTYGG